MGEFLQSTVLIAVAEMGDKSQLAALAFAARYSGRVTLAGITAATLIVHLLSVIVGETVGAAMPTLWVQLASGLAFIGFGLWTLRGDTYKGGETSGRRGRLGPFLVVATTFFLAELGDKTMLATVTLGSQLHAFVPVWLGSTVGMVAADAIAIGVGRVLGRQLPDRAIRLGAATIFIGFGVWTIVDAARASGS